MSSRGKLSKFSSFNFFLLVFANKGGYRANFRFWNIGDINHKHVHGNPTDDPSSLPANKHPAT